MRVAVAGGTGTVGRHVVRTLESQGHQVVVLTRSRGVDITTGQGLDDAVSGADVVIDTSNVTTLARGKSTDFFAASTGHLLDAARRGGVRHLVALSIVGIDRVDNGYYAGKRRQEELVRGGDIPFTLLRATQFHEFAEQMLRRARGPVLLLPRMRVQTVAAAEVGVRLAEIAAGPPLGNAPEMAGPEVHELASLARQVAARDGRRARIVALPVPSGAGRAMANGALLPTGPVTLGTVTFAEWLTGAHQD